MSLGYFNVTINLSKKRHERCPGMWTRNYPTNKNYSITLSSSHCEQKNEQWTSKSLCGEDYGSSLMKLKCSASVCIAFTYEIKGLRKIRNLSTTTSLAFTFWIAVLVHTKGQKTFRELLFLKLRFYGSTRSVERDLLVFWTIHSCLEGYLTNLLGMSTIKSFAIGFPFLFQYYWILSTWSDVLLSTYFHAKISVSIVSVWVKGRAS